MPVLLRHLLWTDAAAGALAGTAMLALAGWLSPLYALPQAFILAMGGVNLAYSAYAFSLARRTQRPRRGVVGLVVANATWAVLCGAAAVAVVGTASVFGVAHLVGEGLLVGGLARLEWVHRERLLVAAGSADPRKGTAGNR